jgi:Parvulin-like peptidyl-prolyl isomerase
MKHLIGVATVLFCLMTFYQVKAQDNVVDEIIWVVGDDIITRSDVENMRIQMLEEGQRVQGDPYCTIPEQMAIQKLYLHQAKLDSVEISETSVTEEVEARINYFINHFGSKEKFEEYAKKPVAAVRDEWRTTYRDMYMVRTMQQQLVQNIKATPVEVRNFYNSLPADSLPYINTTVEVEIVTIEPAISLEEMDRIKSRLREYTDQVNSGDREFSTLALLYSEDKGSAMRGGEVGFTGKGTLMPEYAAVAFELNDPKKVSRIVETEYGFHIIQLIEKRGDMINTRHILIKPKVSDEALEKATQRLDSVRNNIMEENFTFEEAAFYISYDKDTRNNKGLMVNNSTTRNSDRSGTSRFQMDELPSEIAKAIYSMNIGDISKPFIYENSKQKKVAAIVRLKSKVEGHRANMGDDYQVLLNMVEEKKRDEFLEKWVANKIKETYIRINEGWRNCDFQLDGWVQR